MGHAVVARGISPLRVGPGLGDSPLRVVQGVVSLQPSPQRVASLWWSSRPGELSRGVRTDHSPFRELPPVGRVAREPSVCSKKTERCAFFGKVGAEFAVRAQTHFRQKQNPSTDGSSPAE